MNPTEELFAKSREIGRAIWLLTLYWSLQQSDECEWAWVSAGTPIRDSEVASRFQVSVFTAARWREKLRRARLIQVFPRDRGFSIFAYRPQFATKVLEYLDEPTANAAPWPKMATDAVQ